MQLSLQAFSSKRLLSAFVGATLLGGFGMAFAQSSTPGAPASDDAAAKFQPGGEGHFKGSKGGHGHHGGGRCGIMKQLNLTPEQKTKLKTIHETFRKENATEFQALRTKHEQLRALPKDEANADKRKALRGELRHEHQVLMEKHRALMKTVLTPEQIAQMEKAKSECRAQYRQHKGDKAIRQNHSGSMPVAPAEKQ
jgi:Spy/CpxP family protein refolding chaperone